MESQVKGLMKRQQLLYIISFHNGITTFRSTTLDLLFLILFFKGITTLKIIRPKILITVSYSVPQGNHNITVPLLLSVSTVSYFGPQGNHNRFRESSTKVYYINLQRNQNTQHQAQFVLNFILTHNGIILRVHNCVHLLYFLMFSDIY